MNPSLNPVTNLTPTVIPTSLVRLTIIGDMIKNLGGSDADIRIAQAGFAQGLIAGVQVNGLDANGHIRDAATLRYDDLVNDVNLTLDLNNGRSMTEALSVKLAKALEYSVYRMRSQNLRPEFIHLSRPGQTIVGNTIGGLSVGPDTSTPPPGHALREVLRVTPGLDRGLHYSHSTAYSTR